MQIARTEDGSFIISELDPPLIGLFLTIPEAADPGDNAAANDRLYPKPSPDRETREEWREYVEPGLREWFESASATVKGDLVQLESYETLTIAPEHIDAWLSALNQARLALAARFEVNDADMERPVSPVLQNERELALFQIHFYGFLQECLIKGLESDDGE